MTTLSNKNNSNYAELRELLIKNLPAVIKGGNDKQYSNIYEYASARALKKCKFINFNSKEQISFMVFDIDSYKGQTALEYFKNINGLVEHLYQTVGYLPTYALQTDKGFHFAYHLKNHVYTRHPKAVEYLISTKKAIAELTGCDIHGSHRLYGVWRNPLRHQFYYSGDINYELSDFKHFLPKRDFTKKAYPSHTKINKEGLIVGNRNNELFRSAMRFAKGHEMLCKETLVDFLIGANTQCEEPLETGELSSIANSVYIYWQKKTIRFGAQEPKEKNVNEGAMEFPKMAGLSFEEYQAEVKRRQKLSAQRTNQIKDKEKALNSLAAARELSRQKRRDENEIKVLEAIEQLKNHGKKITVSAISKIAGIDRRTVKKYY